MGFTMGFLSGLALITTTGYVTLLAHNFRRSQQSVSLRQQTVILNNIVDPPSEYAPRNSRRELYGAMTPEERVEMSSREMGLVGLAKDGWNKQLQDLVRKVETADYVAMREHAELVGSRIWKRIKSDVSQ